MSILLHTLLVFFGIANSALAGGYDDRQDIPTVNGRCNPIVLPDEVPKEKNKNKWQWLKAHERLDKSGKREIVPFQVMYCREFGVDNATIVREYVIAVEWYR